MSQCNLGRALAPADERGRPQGGGRPPGPRGRLQGRAERLPRAARARRGAGGQKVDLIVISPREAAALTKPVAQAYEAGVPVIVLDRAVLGEQVHLLHRRRQPADRARGRGVDPKDARGEGADRRARGPDDLDPGAGPAHGVPGGAGRGAGTRGSRSCSRPTCSGSSPTRAARWSRRSRASRRSTSCTRTTTPGPTAPGSRRGRRGARRRCGSSGIDALRPRGAALRPAGRPRRDLRVPDGRGGGVDVALRIFAGEKVEKKIVLGSRLYTKANVDAGRDRRFPRARGRRGTRRERSDDEEPEELKPGRRVGARSSPGRSPPWARSGAVGSARSAGEASERGGAATAVPAAVQRPLRGRDPAAASRSPSAGWGRGCCASRGRVRSPTSRCATSPTSSTSPACSRRCASRESRRWRASLEGPVPAWKTFGLKESGNGSGGATWGLPRFGRARFLARFPFGTVTLEDDAVPLKVEITGWSPFEAGDPDSSSLPFAALEYRLTNPTAQAADRRLLVERPQLHGGGEGREGGAPHPRRLRPLGRRHEGQAVGGGGLLRADGRRPRPG